MPRNYQFDLNAERLIDASLMGNDSRFINEPDLALGQTSNCIPESETAHRRMMLRLVFC